MKNFLTKFWAASASLAGIVGLGIGASSIHTLWIFLIVIGISTVFAAIASGAVNNIGTRLLDVGTRLRNYPKLLEQIADLLERVRALQQETGRLTAAAEESFIAGINEGRSQKYGQIMALLFSTIPRLTSISIRENSLVLLAEYEEGESAPSTGFRYKVMVKNTEDERGVVEVVSVNEANRSLVLNCVDRRVPQFWDHLESKAIRDPSAPEGIVLAKYSVPESPGSKLESLSPSTVSEKE